MLAHKGDGSMVYAHSDSLGGSTGGEVCCLRSPCLWGAVAVRWRYPPLSERVKVLNTAGMTGTTRFARDIPQWTQRSVGQRCRHVRPLISEINRSVYGYTLDKSARLDYIKLPAHCADISVLHFTRARLRSRSTHFWPFFNKSAWKRLYRYLLPLLVYWSR